MAKTIGEKNLFLANEGYTYGHIDHYVDEYYGNSSWDDAIEFLYQKEMNKLITKQTEDDFPYPHYDF